MRNIGTVLAVGTLLALGGALTACSTTPDLATMDEDSDVIAGVKTGEVAYAQLTGADGTLHGRLVFTEYETGVEVAASMMALPAGTHGLHIHETGNCTAPAFTSAGGHWNPTNEPHPEHKGDLGNVTAAADGTAMLRTMIDDVSLDNASMLPMLDIDGSAVILHAMADDMVSQPSGAAGARIACGIVAAG